MYSETFYGLTAWHMGFSEKLTLALMAMLLGAGLMGSPPMPIGLFCIPILGTILGFAAIDRGSFFHYWFFSLGSQLAVPVIASSDFLPW